MKPLRFATLCLMLSAPAFADEIPAVWKAKCQSCHGEDGKANTKEGKKLKIEDMTAAGWQTEWTDEKMLKVINDGAKDSEGKPTKMKPFKEKLSAEEINGLIKHIRGFKK